MKYSVHNIDEDLVKNFREVKAIKELEKKYWDDIFSFGDGNKYTQSFTM